MDGDTLFIRIINSIFLFIVSILKTLSSNIVSLLILFILIYLGTKLLISRVITLPCSNCSKGSWWYKCAPNTGYGSYTCRSFNDIFDTTEDVVMIFWNFKTKFYNIIYSLLEHNHNVLKKYFIYIDDMLYAILQLNPAYLLVELIYNKALKHVFDFFKKLMKKTRDIDTDIKIPLINYKIPLTDILVKIVSGMLKLLKKLFELTLKLFALIGNSVYNLIIQPIFSDLITLISNFKDLIMNLFNKLTSDLNTLLILINKPIEIIKDIGIQDILTLIFNHILNFILQTFSINKELLNLLPMIVISLFILCLFFLFIAPILGVLFSCASLIKSFIYLILSCDDDNDFRLLIIKLFI